MSLLFNISPDEPQRKRARAQLAGAHKIETEKPKKPPIYIREKAVRAVQPLGRADDMFDCGDGACGARCHDILQEDGGQWYVECCFCGTAVWVDAVAGHLQPKPVEFTFRDGRFEGLTLSEAEGQPHGLDYIRVCADKHKRQAVRDACRTYLDRAGTSR